MVKHMVKYILTFLGVVFLLTFMLVISAKIPQSAIKENVKESATYLCEGELFGRVVEHVEGSKIDRYSDSILLGIAYQYDSSKPLASVVLSENVMPYVSEHIEERIGGNIGIGPVRYILGSVWNNIKCLFPFEYGIIGALTGITLILVVIYTGYVYHGNHIDRKRVLLYVLIGLIPYIRYVVLHNHSYLHCFFTYRAQMATILAVILIVNELVKEVVAGYKKKR